MKSEGFVSSLQCITMILCDTWHSLTVTFIMKSEVVVSVQECITMTFCHIQPTKFSFECRLSVWFEDFRTVKTDVMIMWVWHLVVWWVGNIVAEEHTAVTCPEVKGWIFLSVIGYHLWDCMSCSRWPQYELLNFVVIWHTHISGRIHTIRLIIRVEVSEWCYTSTIDCHTDRSSWFIIGIIDVKMIIMSVSVEYCCYCVFKPENKYAHYKNLLYIIYKCAHMFFRWNFQKYRRKTSQKKSILTNSRMRM